MSFNEHLKLFLAVLLHELQVLVFEIILHVIIESYFSICVLKQFHRVFSDICILRIPLWFNFFDSFFFFLNYRRLFNEG